ncbi:DUF5696 domain-containing protein [Jeotgalibacillus campisalis]|uniref:Uncharacterized protein n=1 Tax=Jeotgalibacillus campisalis TaxID=220754 RepID=A0A0C2WA22_9BACL|nr:DUF5696 domain-containing protein [Jeotgalibacillus campisalis]KIL52903.1 hypothetical protein KR50_02320 [Jeotgalibacillus campisalis]
MYRRWFGLLLIPFVLSSSVAGANDSTIEKTVEEIAADVPQSIFYQSNQFTQASPEQTDQPSQEEVSEPYELMAENERLALYVEPATLAIKAVNKETGYVWSSGLDHPDDYRLNNTWQQFVQSAITIDYIDQRGNSKTESIQTNSSQTMITQTENGFSAFILFLGANVEMKLEVDLTEEGLSIRVPSDQIDEGKRNRLTSMEIYPFLGSSFDDDREGYMMIPDGSGALIRYGDNSQFATAPFTASIYGNDMSTSRRIGNVLTLPLYGIVHGTNQNGLLNVIESGEHYAELSAYTPGISTDFYWISPTFHYRYTYFQPTSRDMSGTNVYQQDRNDFDIEMNIHVLENEKADYAGMAKTYQEKMLAAGDLVDREDEYSMRLEYLGAESKPGLIWDSIVPMTTADQVRSHVDQLKANGLEDLLLVYQGWTNGGRTNTLPATFPVEKEIGGEDALVQLHDELADEDIPLYLYNEFSSAYKGASGFDGSNDVARQANSQLLSWNATKYFNEMYFMKSSVSEDLAEESALEFNERGLNHMAVDTTGYMLYSDYEEGKEKTREDAEATYKSLFESLADKTIEPAVYKPNPYVWSGTHHYLNMPMYSSNYMMATDTIPFLQMVLKGFIPYYSNYVNFQVNEQQDLLRMAEYGMYPSYFVTGESSSKLANTASSDVFTSQFSIWKEDILQKNERLATVLKEVENETIDQHEVIEPGVVAVTYSNGKTIVVNYTMERFEQGNAQVEPADFKLIEQWEGA